MDAIQGPLSFFPFFFSHAAFSLANSAARRVSSHWEHSVAPCWMTSLGVAGGKIDVESRTRVCPAAGLVVVRPTGTRTGWRREYIERGWMSTTCGLKQDFVQSTSPRRKAVQMLNISDWELTRPKFQMSPRAWQVVGGLSHAQGYP